MDEPVETSAEVARLLRQEVGLFRVRESRRVFDAAVSVGVPAGPRDSFVVRAQDLPALDPALRVDVLAALLEGSGPAWRTAWLTRSGDVEPLDADLDWLRAAATAFGMHGRPLDGFYVITRTGWRDVRTGERRVWKRLRL
jgi:hypothetical protein